MTRARLHLVLLAVALTGCAALRQETGPSPEQQLERAVAALGERDFAAARALLEPLYRAHWPEQVGQRAMLVLIAAELDSRNDTRQLASAADVAARYLGIRQVPDWHVPLVEALYLVALELGANEERLARVEAEREQADRERAEAQEALRAAEDGRTLPTSTRETVPERIRRLTNELAETQRRLRDHEQRLATRERELREAQQEIERIRRTLNP